MAWCRLSVTGPASPALHAVAALAGAGYVALTPDEYAAETAAAGEDPWWLYAFSTMFASIREGRWAAVSEEAARLMGRPPISVAHALS